MKSVQVYLAEPKWKVVLQQQAANEHDVRPWNLIVMRGLEAYMHIVMAQDMGEKLYEALKVAEEHQQQKHIPPPERYDYRIQLLDGDKSYILACNEKDGDSFLARWKELTHNPDVLSSLHQSGVEVGLRSRIAHLERVNEELEQSLATSRELSSARYTDVLNLRSEKAGLEQQVAEREHLRSINEAAMLRAQDELHNLRVAMYVPPSFITDKFNEAVNATDEATLLRAYLSLLLWIIKRNTDNG